MSEFKILNEKLEKLFETTDREILAKEAEKNKGVYKESGVVDETKCKNWNPVYYSEDGKFFIQRLTGYDRVYFNNFDELLKNKKAIEITEGGAFIEPKDEIVGTAYKPLDKVRIPAFDPYDAIQIGDFYVYYPETFAFYQNRSREERKKEIANAKFEYSGKEYIKDINKEKQSPRFGNPSKRYDIDEDTVFFEKDDDGNLVVSADICDGLPYGIKDLKTAVNYVIDRFHNELDREMYAGFRWKYIPVMDEDSLAELEIELLGYPI